MRSNDHTLKHLSKTFKVIHSMLIKTHNLHDNNIQIHYIKIRKQAIYHKYQKNMLQTL